MTLISALISQHLIIPYLIFIHTSPPRALPRRNSHPCLLKPLLQASDQPQLSLPLLTYTPSAKPSKPEKVRKDTCVGRVRQPVGYRRVREGAGVDDVSSCRLFNYTMDLDLL